MSLPESDSDTTLLHNPRCSKSRAALALLEDKGADFSVRLYLEDPLSRVELQELRERLARPVAEWLRSREEAFTVSGLATDAPESALLDLIAAHPIAMERPILIRGSRAVVGRPPENILALL